ncbi:MAG: TonB-dependent receptor [Bacteroidales bacterium]
MDNGTLQPTLGGSTSSWSLLSYIGRANYTFDGKYLATATIRYDGSSRFGEGNKWGLFPSGSLAWRISDEDFMKSLTFINSMKIRAGYGVTGNQEIGNYSFASALQTIKYNFNNSIVNAVVPQNDA